MCVLPSALDTGTDMVLPFWGGAGLPRSYFRRYFMYILAVHLSSITVVTRTFLISCLFFPCEIIGCCKQSSLCRCVGKEGVPNVNGWRGDALLLGERDSGRWGYTGLPPWSDGGVRGGKETQPRIKHMSVHCAGSNLLVQ